MILKTLPILAAAASLAAFTSVHAQAYYGDESSTVGEVVVTAPFEDGQGREVRSTPVDFADLDLNSREGGYTLLARIRGAARVVCTPVSDIRNFADTKDYQRCVRRAVNNAVNDVGASARPISRAADPYQPSGVGSARGQTEKLTPQPQLDLALGLRTRNCAPTSSSTKSISEPLSSSIDT